MGIHNGPFLWWGWAYVDSRLDARLHPSALERDIYASSPLDSLADVCCYILCHGKLDFNRLRVFRRWDDRIPMCSKALFDSKVDTPLVDIRDDDTRSSRKLRHRSDEKANGPSTDNEYSGAGGKGAVAHRAAGCVNGDGEWLNEGGGSVGDVRGEPAGGDCVN